MCCCNPNLNVNKLVDVAIPSPRSLFERFGNVSGQKFYGSGDDFTEAVNSRASKVESLQRADELLNPDRYGND
ncbi:hypothetical protein [Capybara microvirus Cap3_SP_332]|nr:hypothetical protein [Capybara microvirus Cap3_SP_332]